MSEPTRSNTTGAVLVLAMLAMTVVIVLGVAYLEIATSHISSTDSRLTRAQARAVAEGGLEAAYQALASDPDYRGTLTSALGQGAYEVIIVTASDGVEITSIGTVDGAQSAFVSGASLEGTSTEVLDLTSTMVTGTELILRNGAVAQWGGLLKHVNPVDSDGDSTYNGNLEQLPAVPPMVIDTASYTATATAIYPDKTTLPPGIYTGTIYCEGKLEILGPCSIHGTIVTATDLVIFGQGGDVEIVATDSATAVLAGEDFRVEGASQLTIRGSVFSMDSVKIQEIPVYDIYGSAMANGLIRFRDTTGTWEHDPAILDDPPAGVSGGLTRPAGYQEDWRRPLVL